MSQVLNWKVAVILSLLFAVNVMIEASKGHARSPQDFQDSHQVMMQMGLTAGH